MNRSHSSHSSCGKNSYIHFNNSELFDQFVQQYYGPIKRFCCNGTGCELINVSTSDVQKLRYEFLSNNRLFDDTVINNSECAICLEVIVNRRTLGCNHSYCSECVDILINSNISNNKKCPLCRAPFNV
jgi:hypothetical protein